MRPRIAVIGAGAVGGYVGGHLARTGQDVTLIDPWPAHVEAIRIHGLELEGVTPEESCTVRVDAIHLTELQGFSKQRPVDIAIVAVKSYDTEWATTMIRQYLAEGGFVVSLQNCINEERIAALVGWGRTVCGLAWSRDPFRHGGPRTSLRICSFFCWDPGADRGLALAPLHSPAGSCTSAAPGWLA